MKKLEVLIASGPTREPLDPVRYLSNYSTGSMGRFLEAAAKKRGHKVTHVQCPADAETARDLLKKLSTLAPKHDALFMAAAVADARPALFSTQKIKKEGLETLRLVKNPDVVAELSRKKKRAQVFIGFALESRDLFENAREKMEKKALDAILLQPVNDKDRPFGDRPITAHLLEAGGGITSFRAAEKRKLASVLVSAAERLHASKRRD